MSDKQSAAEEMREIARKVTFNEQFCTVYAEEWAYYNPTVKALGLDELPKHLESIADRIDAEYVELPVDKDGVLVKPGDTVYSKKWSDREVGHIEFDGEHWRVGLSGILGGYVYVMPDNVTHERPDSLERIAAEIEEADVDGCADWAARIRKLAKEGE